LGRFHFVLKTGGSKKRNSEKYMRKQGGKKTLGQKGCLRGRLGQKLGIWAANVSNTLRTTRQRYKKQSEIDIVEKKKKNCTRGVSQTKVAWKIQVATKGLHKLL